MNTFLSEHGLKKYGVFYIAATWLLVLFVQFYLYGLFTGLEAEKYIEEAHYLLKHGKFSAPRFIFYSPTIFFIYLSLQVKAGIYGAFFLQAFYNLFVILFFYRSLYKHFQNSQYPFFITFFLIIFLPYSSWAVYLYTESVFYSNILLLISALLNHTSNKSIKKTAFVFFSLLLVVLSRPLGILFILPTLFYFITQASKKTRLLLIPALVLSLAIMIYVSNVIFSTISNVTITLAASQECIVCGIVPEHNYNLNLTNNGTPVYQLFYYLTNNFDHFIKLGLVKQRYFFLMIRNYYSTPHNAGLLAFIIPVYVLSIAYVFSRKQKTFLPFYIFQLSGILLFSITIMLQCDDYHNRFVLSLYPVFLLMAAKGLQTLQDKYLKRPFN